MTAIDQLRAAELIRLDRISYTYDSDLTDPRTRTRTNICLSKNPGQLSFSLTSEDLGLPIDGLTFDLVEQSVDEENSIVTWSVDEALGIWTDYSGLVFEVQRVTASVSLFVAEEAPALSIACDGRERLVRTTLSTDMAPPSTLVIQTNLTAVVVSGVSLLAHIGEELEPIHFGAAIRPRTSLSNGCGYHYQRVATTIDLSANFYALRAEEAIANVTYHWEVSEGLRIEGARDERDVTVELLEPGTHEVSVDVVVTTVTGRTAGRRTTHRFAVLTAEAEMLSRILCTFFQDTLQTWRNIARGLGPAPIRDLVDPLWDPAPATRQAQTFMTNTFALSDLAVLQRSLAKADGRMKKARKLIGQVAEQEARALEKRLNSKGCGASASSEKV